MSLGRCTLFFSLLSVLHVRAQDVRSYNVQWRNPTTEPGCNQQQQPTVQGGMPLGNGDVAVLAWPEANSSSLNLSISKQDAMASDGALFVIAYASVELSPNPFLACNFFEQTLDLASATLNITAGTDSNLVTFIVWVDINSNIVYVSVSGTYEFTATVRIDRVRPNSTFSYSSEFSCLPNELMTGQPDVILDKVPSSMNANSLIIYHRNLENDTFFNDTLIQQGLADILPSIVNPLVNRTFGAGVWGDSSLRRIDAQRLRTVSVQTHVDVAVGVVSSQTASVTEWLQQLSQLQPSSPGEKEGRKQSDMEISRALHEQWWASFWSRSYIHIGVNRSHQDSSAGVNDTFLLSQQYAITRYVQAIQSRGDYPIKFNGMLFVANLPYDGPQRGPDYRQWGPSNWWQNTRLPYQTMFQAGDGDTLLTLFEYYYRMLPFATQRTRLYFNHSGIFFTETKTVWGAFAPADYGCTRPSDFPISLETNDYIKYDYGGNGGSLEVTLYMLDYYSYTQNDMAFTRYLPFISATVEFFWNHYTLLGDEIIFFPAQTLETHWCFYPPTYNNCCINDMPTVSGLLSVLSRLLQVPEHLTTPTQREFWKDFLRHLPPLPLSQGPSGLQLAAAERVSPGTYNSETPELYAVHPYRVFTVGQHVAAGVDLSIAVNAWRDDNQAHSNSGWNQGVMNAALLGLTKEAAEMVIERARTPSAQGYRFQGFAPAEQDYEPSADHFANMNSALQWMLLQTAEYTDASASIIIFPAWPCEWDVSFKLHAPMNTVVEVVYQDHQLLQLTVTPPQRKANVVFAQCVS